MTIFETEEDLKRERKAIETFVKLFKGTFQKLDPYDIDFKVFDESGNLISYAEVKGRIKRIYDAYPLPISAKKLVKLVEKRITPVIIWACEDGIIYGKANELHGILRWGGRPPREGTVSDGEIMVYYDKQKGLKYVRYS